MGPPEGDDQRQQSVRAAAGAVSEPAGSTTAGGPYLPSPDVTLVVSSIGRPSELRRLIDSLAPELELTVGVELVVVDQSPDGRLLEVLEGLGGDAGPALSWVHLRSARGVSRGRNAGLAVARGALVMFPDDDAWFDGDTLARAVAHLAANLDHDGLCTQLRDGSGSPSMLRWAGTAQPVTQRNHHRTSIGSTMVFRTEAARAAGGFDETMGPGAGTWYGSCEDADFLLRVIELGGRIWYDPEAVMNHRDTRYDGGPDAQSKALAYGCGQGRLWRRHRFPRWLIVGLGLRRLVGGMLWSLRGRPGVGRAHRAWVRGSINGWLGRPPVDMVPPEVLRPPAGSEPPGGSELRRSLSWRLLVAAVGTVATFALTTVVARTLPPAEVTVFYALLAALMIGPILGRFGLNQWAVRDLASVRTRQELGAAVALGRHHTRSAAIPAALAAPVISLLFIAGVSHGRINPWWAVVASVILFGETWRLAMSDVMTGLGQTGWAAALAHQVRAIAVTLAVALHLVVWPGELDLDRLLVLMAVVTGSLASAGLYRLWTMPATPSGRPRQLDLLALIRRGFPFLVVDLIVVVVARGDVWLAAPTLSEQTAARYGTASVIASQIGIPIGLASLALAPVVAGTVAQGRLDDVERAVRSLATVVAWLLIPGLAVVVVVGRPMLELIYGAPYGAAFPFLVVLMVGNVALALLGAGPVVLLMSGRHWEAMVVAVSWFAFAGPAAIVAAVVGGPMALAVASALTTVGLYGLLAVTTWIVTGVRLVPYLRPSQLQLPSLHRLGRPGPPVLVGPAGDGGVGL
jgi:O-antigen/teichoic acid export membrane protein